MYHSLRELPKGYVLAKSWNTRLLITDFTTGDVLVFGMYLLHGALDEESYKKSVQHTIAIKSYIGVD